MTSARHPQLWMPTPAPKITALVSSAPAPVDWPTAWL
jgi:hypothetical protein